jgi:hypothetical protein
MKRCVCLVALLGLWVGSVVWAGQKDTKRVDFSGTWALDTNKSDKAPTMQSGGGSMGGGMGRGGGIPGGYPGGGNPGSYPGGGNPGGYPGGGNPGGYPGGGNPGSYPGGGNPGGYPGGGRAGGGRGDNVPGDANPLLDAIMTIEQTASELRITRGTGTPDEKKQEFRQVYKLDGSESINPGFRVGGEFRSRTSWEKDKLVILGMQKGSNDDIASEIVIKCELTLSKDGKTLTLKTIQSGMGGGSSLKQVFARNAGNLN